MAGNSSGGAGRSGEAFQDLGLDQAALDGPELRNLSEDILEMIFSYLGDPASVKAASLVSR